MKKKPQFHASVATDGALELMIYGDIVNAGTMEMLEAWGYATDSMTCALGVKQAMDSAGNVTKVRLRINSPGGDAFEGMAIHSLLASCGKPVEAFIDGIAASSASIVAMAASSRTMGRTAMMMVHNAWTDCRGNKNDLLKMADTLDTVDESIAAAYMDRTGMSLDDVKALMDAETWMTAQDCMDQGFATAVAALPAEEENAAMAMARGFRVLAKLKHVPEALKPAAAAEPALAAAPQTAAPPAKPALHARAKAAASSCACDCENCEADDCSNCTNAECEDANCKDCPMQAGESNESNLSLYEARAKMLRRRA